MEVIQLISFGAADSIYTIFACMGCRASISGRTGDVASGLTEPCVQIMDVFLFSNGASYGAVPSSRAFR